MTAPVNIEVYSDALVVLGTAGIVLPVVRHWGINPVLGYLGAGALLGPLGLGSFKDALPFLHRVTVVDAQNVAGIADLGVVFLLFMIGLDLSYERLFTMRRLVFGLGSLQVIFSSAALAGLAALAGNTPAASVILGICLALSSTAIVLEVLSGQGRLATEAGRTSFSILVAQDLAVVPLLLFIPMIASNAGEPVWASLLHSLAKAALALGAIVTAGRLVLRPLFHLVASTGASDLFMATTLFVVVATGVLAGRAGLSMALGAFVVGLLLAETEFNKAIETVVEPFKGILLGLFFFTIGMSIDFREVVREPLLLLASLAAIIGTKSVLLFSLARLFRVRRPAAIEGALLLAPAGEFAFVGIAMAASLGVIGAHVSSLALAAASLSMALIPLMPSVARRLSARTGEAKPMHPELSAVPEAAEGHAIVVGHGRVGQVVCTLLERHGFPYLACDRNPDLVSEHRRRERAVYYGDAANTQFLNICGLQSAKAVIVTINAPEVIDEIVTAVRTQRADIVIVSRARDAAHARHLYAIGVTDAVPETIEASLQLSEAALVGVGLAAGPVIASIHELRDEFRYELQHAAREAGQETTRSIRRKTVRRT